MKTSHPRACGPASRLAAAATLALMAFTSTTLHAQSVPNGRILVPIAPVMAQAETLRLLKGVKVGFGAAAKVDAKDGSELTAMSWARQNDARGSREFNLASLPDGRQAPMTPVQQCQLALRYTLENVADAAIERGSREVVGLVSFNEGVAADHGAQVECLIWRSSNEVNLKGIALKPAAGTSVGAAN